MPLTKAASEIDAATHVLEHADVPRGAHVLENLRPDGDADLAEVRLLSRSIIVGDWPIPAPIESNPANFACRRGGLRSGKEFVSHGGAGRRGRYHLRMPT